MRFISLFLHPKGNFCLLAHLSNICHIKLFTIIATGPNLEAQSFLMSSCIDWSFFLGSNFLSYTSLLQFPMTHLWESHQVWYSSDECSCLECRPLCVRREVLFVAGRLKWILPWHRSCNSKVDVELVWWFLQPWSLWSAEVCVTQVYVRADEIKHVTPRAVPMSCATDSVLMHLRSPKKLRFAQVKALAGDSRGSLKKDIFLYCSWIR